MRMVERGGVVLLVLWATACGGSPTAPDGPQIPDCELYDTGTLVLVNVGETLTPRDAYVDGNFVDTIPYGNQIALAVDASVVHTVEWVSTIRGEVVSSARLVVDTCSRYTLTNYF